MRAALACIIASILILSTACTPADDSVGPASAATVTHRPPRTDALPVTTLACGAQVSGDVTLDNDLDCVGNGFSVSGDDIAVDLNGHTISGNGTGNGITVNTSHRVRIFGGSIRGFQSGIFVASSSDVMIRDNEFSATNQAVLLQ